MRSCPCRVIAISAKAYRPGTRLDQVLCETQRVNVCLSFSGGRAPRFSAPGSACQRRRQNERSVSRLDFHLKIAVVWGVTAGGFAVSLASTRADDAAAENRSVTPVAPTAARRRI
jgi:hypothetical protein